MKKFFGGISFYVLLIIVVLSVITMVYMPKEQNKKIYSDLLVEIQKDNVERLDISDSQIVATLRSDPDNQLKVDVYNLSLFYQDAGEEFSERVRNGEIAVEHHIPSTMPAWVSLLAPIVLFALLMLLYVFVIMPGMQGGGGGRGSMPFSKMKARVNIDAQRRVTFEDVAGADEEKEELKEVVEFLKNPKRFVELGARIPKGVLLVGPPGTGKTLLAKAVAGEAEVPFFSISGSDFVELYVGVGASRVRDLFEQAKKNQPSIVFIDEIDAVGRHRGAGMGGGHDEREQTLNQLLVEMDGFGENQGVIVIAATNRPDILDPALLRPGRFDRQVEVGYPDIKGREAILKVHSRKKPLGDDVDLLTVAKTTVGFTGADLENLLNEAALLTARNGQKQINMESIEKSIIKVIAGPEKSSRVVQERDKKITAYHEAGHAIVSHLLPTQDPVHHVTIIPRGRAAGFTMNLPVQDKGHQTKNEMLEDIVTLLAGRVSEKIIFDDISAGASNDIERATKIANHMVTRYGMSDKLGPISYGGENDEVFLGRDYGHSRAYSENMAAAIDAEVESIIDSCYKRALALLTEHQDKLVAVAEALLEREKLDGDEFVKVFNGEELPKIHQPEKAEIEGPLPFASETVENAPETKE